MSEPNLVAPGASARNSGVAFNDLTGASMTNTGLKGGGDDDKRRHIMVLELMTRLRRVGWENATIVNLNSFPLFVNLGPLGIIGVAAGSPTAPSRAEITLPRIQPRDLGGGNFAPEALMPVELAQEVEQVYAKTGGVFYYTGTGAIPQDRLASAKAAQLGWMKREYAEAEDSWQRYHQYKMITDRQRDAANYLYSIGEVAALPPWVTVTRADSGAKTCPMCGENVKVAARICRFCRHSFDESTVVPAPSSSAQDLQKGRKTT